ncbi:MAG: HAD-IA family hydrolase [Candidatus Micrarchaeota archaeon]|nr:HAD-IA family hydrolase [Candidatus Micrarchaeota archaeon]
MRLRTLFRFSDVRILLAILIFILFYYYEKLNVQNLPELVIVLIATYIFASFLVIIGRKFRKLYKGTAVAFDMGGVLTKGEYFTQEIQEIPRMKDLMKELKKYHLIAICSNNNWEAYLAHEKKYGWDEIFDVEVLSGKYGVQKPNPKIYKILLDKLGVQPKNCVFVDDKEENVDAARKLGIKGIVFTSHSTLVQELKKLNYL